MIGYLSESESEYRLRKIGRKLKSFYISRTDWQFEAKSFWCNRKVFLKSRTSEQFIERLALIPSVVLQAVYF